MRMIDTHCHLNFETFDKDWRETADRAIEAGVSKMIVVGTDLATSKRAVELAQLHPALYAAVGIHPHHTKALLSNAKLKTQISELITQIAELAKQPKVVAIGELGLDYHVFKQSKYPDDLLEITPELKELQRELFIAQVQLAIELNKPLIIHSREAKEEVLETLSGHFRGEIRGVFHCFGGSKKYTKRILDAGFYLGFDGDITYVPDRLGVATSVPLERLLLETDSPYLTPKPHRGQRNEPINIRLIAEAHARARGIRVEEIMRVTSENAEKLFFVG